MTFVAGLRDPALPKVDRRVIGPMNKIVRLITPVVIGTQNKKSNLIFLQVERGYRVLVTYVQALVRLQQQRRLLVAIGRENNAAGIRFYRVHRRGVVKPGRTS